MAVTLTGYGGVEEIGGNAFLLDDGRTRLMLDLGKRFGNDKGVEEAGLRPGWNDYFDEFLQPRTFRMVPDLLALGLIPDIPGLYRRDLGGDDRVPDISAIVLSHGHTDHTGLVGLVQPQVPILTSLETRATMASMQETGGGGAESEYVRTKAKGHLGRKQDGNLTSHPRFNPGPERPFLADERHDVGDWDVRQFPVDHSIHGARATVLSGKQLTLAYTGDFRMHGRQKTETERFVERAGDVDVLVAEGTRVDRPSDKAKGASGHGGDGAGGHGQTDEEVQVEAEIEEAVAAQDRAGGTSGFVGVSYPPRDLDRFQSIHAVARRLGRKVVITTKQAHLLETLRAAGRDDLPDPMRDPSVAVHLAARNKGLIRFRPGDPLPVADDLLQIEEVQVDGAEYLDRLEADYAPWERKYLGWDDAIASRDVGKEPNGYIFSINYWSITDLFDIFPDRARASGLYIHSQTQPFNDDMVQGDRKLARWLRAFNLDRRDTHVSGHVDDETLQWVIDEIRPRILVPVHSLAPGYTAERYEARTGNKTVLPQAGRPAKLVP